MGIASLIDHLPPDRCKRLTALRPDGGWADRITADLSQMAESSKRAWEALLRHALAVRPPPPAAGWQVDVGALGNLGEPDFERRYAEKVLERRCDPAWHERAKPIISEIGPDDFWGRWKAWIERVPNSKPGCLSHESLNRELMRGLLWIAIDSTDPQVPPLLAGAATFFFRKNSPLGVPCVVALAGIGTAEALAQLTVLAGRVKAAGQKMLIAIAREQVAAKSGLPVCELDDVAIPTSGLTDLGRRAETLAGFTAEIVVVGSSVEVRWKKPDGRPQKSVPAAAKREHAAEIKELKRAASEVETTLAMLARRFESAPLTKRSWRWPDWKSRYLEHPVAGTLVRRLLWNVVSGGRTRAAAVECGRLVDIEGSPISTDVETRIAVWHPMGSDAQEVLAWRAWLFEREVTQPFKQAHREVYLLTDAERQTSTYSNRFAAHILTQSQFRAVAKSRGWKTSYLGAWDAGDDGVSRLDLPEWNYRAEFWVTGAGEEYAHAGGYYYVATDQIRFYRTPDESEPVSLEEVPPLIYSEVFRDVDLFVGVASVGNNPVWQDGGPDGRYRTYWERYSFGELLATAVTRKAALEKIIPRLKIADRCRFDGRFLIVRGDLRTYRIHVGSGNILMEPNNQYLCVVPSRRSKFDGLRFLPFEGDLTLSLILSKAIMLADDSRITDGSIVNQIAGARHVAPT